MSALRTILDSGVLQGQYEIHDRMQKVALDGIKAEIALTTALRDLAANMRDLHRYYVHNSASGVEVWDELACEIFLAAAEAALARVGAS